MNYLAFLTEYKRIEERADFILTHISKDWNYKPYSSDYISFDPESITIHYSVSYMGDHSNESISVPLDVIEGKRDVDEWNGERLAELKREREEKERKHREQRDAEDRRTFENLKKRFEKPN